MVICTHLHTDHVGGWNTQLVDGRWVPTFPHARYRFVRSEYDYWTKYVNDSSTADSYTEFAQQAIDVHEVYRDSIAPIVEAGLVDWLEPNQEVVPGGVTVISTPGHTPGHVSVLLESGDETASSRVICSTLKPKSDGRTGLFRWTLPPRKQPRLGAPSWKGSPTLPLSCWVAISALPLAITYNEMVTRSNLYLPRTNCQ